MRLRSDTGGRSSRESRDVTEEPTDESRAAQTRPPYRRRRPAPRLSTGYRRGARVEGDSTKRLRRLRWQFANVGASQSAAAVACEPRSPVHGGRAVRGRFSDTPSPVSDVWT